MPEVSRFLGIVIFFNWKDHNPPHIHFKYAGVKYSISITDRKIKGTPPPKIVKQINQWMDEHIQEIEDNWVKAQRGEKELKSIEPLR